MADIAADPGSGFPLQGAVSAQETGGDGPEVDPELLAEASRSDSLDFLIVFGGQVDLSAAYEMEWSARGWYVYETLKANADSAQAEVRAYLDQVGISYQAFLGAECDRCGGCHPGCISDSFYLHRN